MAEQEIVAFDLEGTLTAGVAWEGMRDYLKAHGRHVIIVSGMFEPILQLFAAKLQVASIGTPIELVDGRLTGEIIGQLNVGPLKVDRLQQMGRLVAAYGDTVRDIPMLELAETAVAVHPDPKLRQAAEQHGWRIITN